MQHRLKDGGLELRPETPLEGIEVGKLYRDLQRRRLDCRIDEARPALVLTLAPAREEPRETEPRPREEYRPGAAPRPSASDVTPVPEELVP